jgi:hypothetical protein
MPTDTRDKRAIDAVPCPVCLADVGEVCRMPVPKTSLPYMLLTHRERREAYRVWRDKNFPDWERDHNKAKP